MPNGYKAYLESVMRGLSNMLYNASQNPSTHNCNIMLDSIKRTLEEYERVSGNKVDIKDFRTKV